MRFAILQILQNIIKVFLNMNASPRHISTKQLYLFPQVFRDSITQICYV
jgi:hypothetical protein